MVKGTTGMLIFLLSFVCVYGLFYRRARRGFRVPFRRLAGLDAIDEAIGRCTEMGRPVHFSSGRADFDAGHLAAFNVLEHVARACARLGTDIILTNALPDVHVVAESVVQNAYASEGKLDSYKPDNVRFVGWAQGSYVSSVYGIFSTERPGASLLLGSWTAEALMVAEVGNVTGAIQIAGTGQITQVPFFVAACDYTLLGDELYAAGAYLSQQPSQIASIAAQDFGKWAVELVVLVGSILATFGNKSLMNLLKL